MALDRLDRACSLPLQKLNSTPVEYLLIVPAFAFNRAYALFSFAVSLIMGGLRSAQLQSNLGYMPSAGDPSGTGQQIRLGAVFMLVYMFAVVGMVTTFQIMKYTIKRARPTIAFDTVRRANPRKAEEGTYSMPSGDVSCCALFCFLFTTVLDLPWVYILLPLVACGRVFYQCHYFGDTLVGAGVGSLWGLAAYSYF